MKKKLFALLTATVVALSTVACGGSDVELTGEFTFDVPEGFTETEANTFVAPNYPEEASNINWLTLENDGSFDSTTSKALIESVESELETAYGGDITISLLEEEKYEINGRRALKYAFEYELMGMKIVQLQCIIEDREELIFLTYTEFAEEGYYDDFQESVKTVRFE